MFANSQYVRSYQCEGFGLIETEKAPMKNRILFGTSFLLLFVTLQAAGQVRTNKDALLTVAVRGTIAPSHFTNFYPTTWDGRAKVVLGIGGINYELKLGENVFGWAAADRATMGVATACAGANSSLVVVVEALDAPPAVAATTPPAS